MQFEYNYAGMGRWLVGPESRRIVEASANQAMLLYQALVAKRTGELARSAHVTTRVGGLRGARQVGVMIVGSDSARYAASHEFGTDLQAAHDDLRQVLEMLGRT